MSRPYIHTKKCKNAWLCENKHEYTIQNTIAWQVLDAARCGQINQVPFSESKPSRILPDMIWKAENLPHLKIWNRSMKHTKMGKLLRSCSNYLLMYRTYCLSWQNWNMMPLICYERGNILTRHSMILAEFELSTADPSKAAQYSPGYQNSIISHLKTFLAHRTVQTANEMAKHVPANSSAKAS